MAINGGASPGAAPPSPLSMVAPTIALPSKPDAPSSVSVLDNAIAVADFYNNRIIYTNGDEDRTFGEEGMDDGQLNYPTDVQFAHDQIYVADA